MPQQHVMRGETRGDNFRFRCSCSEKGDWRDTTGEAEADAGDHALAVGDTFGTASLRIYLPWS
jgi:hypothetical protein